MRRDRPLSGNGVLWPPGPSSVRRTGGRASTGVSKICNLLFCKNSKTTLLNRSCSLKKCVLWSVNKLSLEPLSEPLLFLCLQELQAQQAKASTAGAPLRSFTARLGLRVHIDVLRSHRGYWPLPLAVEDQATSQAGSTADHSTGPVLGSQSCHAVL